MFSKLVKGLAGLVICAAASGCTVETRDRPPPGGSSYGTLTALWTLDRSDDPNVCSFYAVDRVDVVVFDDADFVVAEAQPFCEDFGVSFDLRADWYSTEVTLLDSRGFAVSDTVVVDTRVLRDTEVVIDVDFPDDGIF